MRRSFWASRMAGSSDQLAGWILDGGAVSDRDGSPASAGRPAHHRTAATSWAVAGRPVFPAGYNKRPLTIDCEESRKSQNLRVYPLRCRVRALSVNS